MQREKIYLRLLAATNGHVCPVINVLTSSGGMYVVLLHYSLLNHVHAVKNSCVMYLFKCHDDTDKFSAGLLWYMQIKLVKTFAFCVHSCCPHLWPLNETKLRINIWHHWAYDNDNDNVNIFIAMNYITQCVQAASLIINCFMNNIHFT